MSFVFSFIQRLFPKTDFRVLMIGLDSVGKTTMLYKLKLGDVVTTIPTIGFNVETVCHKGLNFTSWDVGGCDKIRPLWRHYYQNTQAVIFVIDCHDLERFHRTSEDDIYYSVEGLFDATISEEELRDAVILIYLNKIDLEQKISVEMVQEVLGLNSRYRNRIFHVQPCCSLTAEGLYEGLDWLTETLRHPPNPRNDGDDSGSSGSALSGEGVVAAPPTTTSASSATAAPVVSASSSSSSAAAAAAAAGVNNSMSRLEEWLSRVDEDDDVFLRSLQDLTLTSWDHYTHLRIAYLLLKRHGRPKGLPLIFSLLKNFIELSPYLNHPHDLKLAESSDGSTSSPAKRKTTFHETMTYFWVHMVHYALVSTTLPEDSFHAFLFMNPQLADSGLFLHYYRKERLLLDPKARVEVVLPDIKPLPSLIAKSSSAVMTPASLPPSPLPGLNEQMISDEEYYCLFRSYRLPAWGHLPKLRVIYLLLVAVTGRRGGGSLQLLEELARCEGGEKHSHLTVNYFWIHMMTCAILYAVGVRVKESSSSHESVSKIQASYGKVFSATLPSPPPSCGGVLGEGEGAKDDWSWPDSLESFADFWSRLKNYPEDLSDPLLINKYYSKKVLEEESSRHEAVLPDLQPLPNPVLPVKS